MAAPVYDDQKTTPDDDELRHITGISPHDEAGIDSSAHNGAAEDIARSEGLHNPISNENENKSNSPLSPEGLQSAEKNSGSTSNSSTGGNVSANTGSGGFWKAGSSNTKGGFGATVRHIATSSVAGRRKFVVGGAAGGTALLILFGLSAVAPFELVHIEQNLLKHEAKVEHRFETTDAKKLIKKILKDAKGRTSDQQKAAVTNDVGTDNFSGMEPLAVNDVKDSAIGQKLPLAATADSFDVTSPAVVADFAKSGITVDAPGNVFESLKDAKGNSITTGSDGSLPDNLNDSAYTTVEASLPEWNAGQIISFRPDMVAHVDASFSVVPDKPGDNIKEDTQIIENTVENGAQNTPPGDITVQEKNSNDPNSTTADQQAASNINDANSALTTAEATVMSEVNSGKSLSQAINDATTKFHLGSAVFVSAIISDICMVDKVATVASAARVPQIMTLLIRHATTTISLADQIKNGHITGNGVNAAMQVLNGDPSAKNTDGTPSEASMPFSSSAAWGSAVGDKGGIPIDKSSLPNANTGTGVVNEINSIKDAIPGANQICAVENSRLGIVVNLAANGVQLIGLDFSTLGAGQIATTGLIGGVQGALQLVVIPDILKYFTPVGVSGHENSVQYMNNTDAGANLSFNDYARRIGANPVNTSTADSLTTAADQGQVIANSHMPWLYRTFALSNPSSLVSHLADSLPLGVRSNVSSLANYFASIPSTLLHDFSSIFLHKAIAATTSTNPGDVYGVTQYAFQDNELNKYDPSANEQILYKSIGDVQCVPPPGHFCAWVALPRIKMLGNPATYVDSPQGDPDKKDLMHCYVDGFYLPNGDPEFEGGGQNKYCADVGKYDYTAAPNPTVPGNNEITTIYCEHLEIEGANEGLPVQPNCPGYIATQLNDDAYRWRQYDLNWHVMSDYTTLTTNQ